MKTRTYEDWFYENDEKIKEAIYAKNKSCMEWLNEPSSVSMPEKFKDLRAKVQADLRLMPDLWWRDKAAEVQHYADTQFAEKRFRPICLRQIPTSVVRR